VKGWLGAAWRGMGPWKWLGVAAILIVVVLTPVTAQGHDAGTDQVISSTSLLAFLRSL